MIELQTTSTSDNPGLVGQLAAQLLVQQREKLQLLLDNAPVGIWMQNGSGKLEFVNRAFCTAMGIPEQTFLAAAHYKDVLPGAYVPMCLASDAKALGHEGVTVTEQQLPFADGRVHDLRVYKAVKRDEQGHPLALVGIAIDITDEILKERALTFWSRVADAVQDAILVCDRDGAIERCNPAFTRMTGYAQEQVEGRRLDSLLVHPESDHIAGILTDGQDWQGEAILRARNGHRHEGRLAIAPLRGEDGVLERLAVTFTDLTPLREAESRIHHITRHDAMTGLPNRARFKERLQQAMDKARDRNAGLALVLLGLDDFRHINDSHGHQMGDALLTLIASRLRRVVREQDVVARLAGDEFAIFREETGEDEEAYRLAQAVLDEIARPAEIEGQTFNLSASAGIALFPYDGDNVAALLRNCDSALAEAKQQDRGHYRFYAPEMTESVVARARLENDLRGALKRREMEVWYQPQVDLATSRVVGVEALVRWRHPSEGFIPPARFIPMAERARLIDALGDWVLRQACGLMRVLRAERLSLQRVAVNVSPVQLQKADFADRVEAAMLEAGCEVLNLELEVTESTLLANPDVSIANMARLRDLGVRVAIDDFGVGYSSLSLLRALPLDCLKIDASFVAGLPGDGNASAIIRAVMAMAHALHLEVLAEGVETEEQAGFLVGAGCDSVQGFLYAHPMPEPELLDWLKSWSQAHPRP